jgi:YHS domain-containing protein
MDGLFTLLLYAALFYLFMRFGCGAHLTHGHHHGHDKTKGKDIFIDPVCDRQVPGDEGYGELVEGRLFRFCSKDCLEEFDKNKSELSKKPNTLLVKEEQHHEA